MAASHKGPKKDGKEDKKAANDYGAHEMFSAADSPASVKAMASGKANYKHRES